VGSEGGHHRGDAASEHYLIAIEHAWAKANKYYEKTDESPVYVVAIVVDPRRKWQYIDHMWSHQPNWIENAKARVAQLWEIEYKTIDDLPRQDNSPVPQFSSLRSFF